MRASLIHYVAFAVAMPTLVYAQNVGLPGNPEATDARAAVAPSTKLTPDELLKQSAAEAVRGDVGAAVKDDIQALRRGPLLVHGNYCGVGSRPGTPPVDLLDAACMRHDACTRSNTLPTCACNNQLRAEATAVAQDPRTPGDLQVLATTVAASMAVLICR